MKKRKRSDVRTNVIQIYSWSELLFFFFHQCRAKPAGREGQERNHPLACSYTLNVFSERKRKTAVWLRNPGILYNQVKLAVKAKDAGQEGEHRKTGKPNWKEEAQSTELEKRGGEEVNRGRGEICVTAAAWGSPTEQRGMLLMDMSDIVLTSSLWILQQTHTHTESYTHVKTYGTQTHPFRSVLVRTLHWHQSSPNPSPTYFMFTFVTLDFYVVSMSLFIPLKTCIFERQTCVYVDKNVLCHCQSRAATTGRFINWITDRKLVANYWWFESR